MAARTPGHFTSGQVLSLQRTAGNRAVRALLGHPSRRAPGLVAVQRAIGVELEESKWTVSADRGMPIQKGTAIVDRPTFELQAEYGGEGRFCLEIVTKAPGVDEATYPTMIGDIETLIADLDRQQSKGPFAATALAGGVAGYQITPGKDAFSPFLQITVGVPLATLPSFFKRMKAGNLASVRQPDDKQSAQTVQDVKDKVGIDNPSGKLQGFIFLLQHYMLSGVDPSSFPKGSIEALAKTDFAETFMMLPRAERSAIRQHLDEWVQAVAQAAKGTDEARVKYRQAPEGIATEKRPLMANSYYDPMGGVAPMTMTMTREEWLKAMVSSTDEEGTENKGTDILTAKSKLAEADTSNMKKMHPLDKEALKLGTGITGSGQGQKGDRNVPEQLKAVAKGKLSANKKKQYDAVAQLVEDLRSFHEGFGALGTKKDQISYLHEHPDHHVRHRAVIIEIRRPTGTWRDAANGIVAALTAAIHEQAPKSKTGEGPRFASRLPASSPDKQATTVVKSTQKLADTAKQGKELQSNLL